MEQRILQRGAVALLTMLLVLVAPEATQAATLVLPLQAHCTISDTTGQVRILVDFGDLEVLAGKRILYAKCYLNIDVDTCVSLVNELEVRPLTTSWAAQDANWEDGWVSPGGDFSDELVRTVDFQAGRDGDTEIVVTELIQAWVDGQAANHGLILIPRIGRCEYHLEVNDGYPQSGYGKLLVRYGERQ
jgi:hypothetical protein